MKKLMLSATLLVVFTLTAMTQNKTNHSKRFACPNETKDTLFVVKDMYPLMNSLWNNPIWRNDKPIIVPVKTIDPYAIRMGLSIKAVVEK